METYVYLHGFASSPQSLKAQTLRDRFRLHHIYLHTPDLNQDDFSTLTLTRQIQQVEADLATRPGPVTLIGSSFGGLTAAWVGERLSSVHRLILLAPAFEFLKCWLPRLGEGTLQQWQINGTLPIYHYRDQRTRPLNYAFITDLQRYADDQIQRPIPTLIVHGVRDETIPIQASQRYTERRPWVQLQELNSDHALTDSQDVIWTLIQAYCNLNPSHPY